MYGWVGCWMDWLIDGQMDGWMDGWMDGFMPLWWDGAWIDVGSDGCWMSEVGMDG